MWSILYLNLFSLFLCHLIINYGHCQWSMYILFCLHPEKCNGSRFNVLWWMIVFDRFVLVTEEICSQVNIHGAFLREKKIPGMFLNALPFCSSMCVTKICTCVCIFVWNMFHCRKQTHQRIWKYLCICQTWFRFCASIKNYVILFILIYDLKAFGLV